MTGRGVWLSWTATRLLVLLLLFGPESRSVGDVVYLSHAMRDLGDRGVADTLREYPVTALGVVALLWGVAALLGSTHLFGFLLVVGCLGLDATFLRCLQRAGRATDDGRRRAAEVVWLLAVPAMGGISFARLDLLPGVLVGLVVLLAAARPRVAAAVLASATAIKLWPALLIPALVLRTRRRGAVVAVTGLVGTAAVAGTVLLSDWARVVSPLTYQAHRGLQIESVAAGPAMVGWLASPHHYRIFFSHYMAYEVRGPMTGLLQAVTTLVSALMVGSLLLAWWRSARRGSGISADGLVWLCLTATTGFICASKVLSPQYFLWLLPAAAAGLLVVEASYAALRRWTGVLLGVTVLSHAVWPWLYRSLAVPSGLQSVAAVGVLELRNLLTVVLLAEAARQTVRSLRGRTSSTEGVDRRLTTSR